MSVFRRRIFPKCDDTYIAYLLQRRSILQTLIATFETQHNLGAKAGTLSTGRYQPLIITTLCSQVGVIIDNFIFQ